ncbi:hypothetical protein ACQKMV_05345 [Lysinibacillus sp. NPDC094403]|uniref:hypothetical protein n=1 Tax=Lysinibacillus sp. NPDC094403 TaxID=3390581 RepID=UPI003D07C87B
MFFGLFKPRTYHEILVITTNGQEYLATIPGKDPKHAEGKFHYIKVNSKEIRVRHINNPNALVHIAVDQIVSYQWYKDTEVSAY